MNVMVNNVKFKKIIDELDLFLFLSKSEGRVDIACSDSDEKCICFSRCNHVQSDVKRIDV